MIELHHVVKRYPNADRPALDDLSLRVDKGEFCLLTGPSGAGKSTLLRLLFCAEFPTAGEVVVGGRTLGRLPRRHIPQVRRNLGVVFQDFKLLASQSAFDNVALALEVQGRSRADIRERCDKILQQVGLTQRMDAPVGLLSGGEQQRVAIARALVTDPAVVLADEPTGNLDPARAQDIMELLVRAHLRGATVLVATHDPVLLERYPQRVLTLREGRLVRDERAAGFP